MNRRVLYDTLPKPEGEPELFTKLGRPLLGLWEDLSPSVQRAWRDLANEVTGSKSS